MRAMHLPLLTRIPAWLREYHILSRETAALILFSLWPFSNFGIVNLQEGIDYFWLSITAIFFSMSMLVLFVLLQKLFPQRSHMSLSTFLILTVILFFNYSGVSGILDGLKIQRVRYHLFLFFLSVGSAWFLAKIRSIQKISLIMAIIIMLFPFGRMVHFLFSRSSLSMIPLPDSLSFQSHTSRRHPNIYYVILDAYARQDVLREMYDYDNTWFIEALRSKGFYVADKSYSNYPYTMLSLPTTFQMDFVTATGKNVIPDRKSIIAILKKRNRVIREFRGLGYTFANFNNMISSLSGCGGLEDICIQNTGAIKVTSMNYALLSLTPLRVLQHHWLLFTPKSNGIPDLEAAIPRLLPRAPFFLFAHVVSPHGPFIYRKDCSLLNSPKMELTYSEEDISYYLEQLECVSKQTLSLIDRILASDPNSWIIIQSDHGPAQHRQPETRLMEWNQNLVHESYGILNAYRISDVGRRYLYPSISPVNSFRVVLAALSGQQPILLPDRKFAAASPLDPDFGNVALWDDSFFP